LKERDLKKFLNEFSERFSVNIEEILGSSPSIEIAEISEDEIYLSDKRPILVRIDGMLSPTLIFTDMFQFLPEIVVDMGAIPYICSGADVMSPGIVRVVGSFKNNDFVLIKDERHNETLAIGIALLDSKSMIISKQGKMIKNINYVGDKIWSIIKSLHSFK